MEIIAELESEERGPYTGSMGYISSTGDMAFNIAIRTLYSLGGRLKFHVGGGVVSDSIVEKEWDETWNKAQGMLRALERVGG